MKQYGEQMANNILKQALDRDEVIELGIKDIAADNIADVLMYRCIRILDFYEPDMLHEAPQAREQVLYKIKSKLDEL